MKPQVYSLDHEKVLKKIPEETNCTASITVPEAMHDMLKEYRFGLSGSKTKQKKT